MLKRFCVAEIGLEDSFRDKSYFLRTNFRGKYVYDIHTNPCSLAWEISDLSNNGDELVNGIPTLELLDRDEVAKMDKTSLNNLKNSRELLGRELFELLKGYLKVSCK
ncbi:hypothetical protein CMI42_03085 [Candidatus Pacearchaeota archaeon]|nr:hypothetical protein [Candidatus Pacearchaeota archaeon]|tara:strand:- start:528 stop:848 length:321 start_codon:yes stop_codon:yes gene_type:complete